MEIRFKKTGTVVTEDSFRAIIKNNDGPTWNETTPEIAELLNAEIVLEGIQPQPTRYQTVFRDGVEQINGQWFTKYSVADMDANAIAAKDADQASQVRSQRNVILADWVDRMNPLVWEVMTDEEKQECRNFRQALLDLSDQPGFPWNVTMPEVPTVLAKKN